MVEIVKFAVSVVQVAVDAPAACGVGRIVGVCHGKSLRDSKLRFDQVDPGRFRGGPHGMNVQAAQQSQKTRVVMDMCKMSKTTNSCWRG